MKKYIALTVSVLLLTICFFSISFAAPAQYDINIDYFCDNACVPYAEFKLYHVADVNSDGSFSAAGVFESFPIILNGLDTDGMIETANALDGLVLMHEISPVATGKTEADGKLSFSRLTSGMYLLIGSRTVYDGDIYTVSPGLYILPGDGGKDITINPKAEHISDTDTNIDIKVAKSWDDKGFEKMRPDSIGATLYRDGKYYDSVKLTAETGWSYVWNDLDSRYIWTAVENLEDGYFYTVIKNGDTFVFRNAKGDTPEFINEPTTVPEETTFPAETTFPEETTATVYTTNPTETTTPTETTEPGEKIPNTGLLIWPVTVFSIIGAFLIIVGWAFIRKSEYEDNE